MEKNFEAFIDAWKNIKNEYNSFVSVTLVQSKGSAPQDMGARMITDGESVLFGTVGGGKIEAYAIRKSLELLNLEEKKSTHHEQINLQRDIGMSCGGEVSLFFDVYSRESLWKIYIFGAGHVSQELCRCLTRLNCHLVCIDHRQEWLDKLPANISTECLSEPKDFVSQIEEDSFVILMTMGHGTDGPILNEILKQKELPYVGVIGSNSKANLLKKEMKEQGHNSLKCESFICPIGDSIGDNSPAEIAISITSQLLRAKDKAFKTPKRMS
ncbi:MAG: xanthine dehydrogenase accessory protein XdhC [Bacteriovoracaceae bacterium]|nr:xanthine dehydrogenase accessory protein XdhC [Bacteriovoracaceae bacterium]